MPITKEFKTIEEQINTLKSRELKFKNEFKAKNLLMKYNYFDLINGFESLLLSQTTPLKKYENIFFEDFYDLYKFDLILKELTLFKIFDFESRLRTSIAYNFSAHYCTTSSDIMNYINPTYYQSPSPSDTHLCNKFRYFSLFQTTTSRGGRTILGFIDKLKADKEYANQYVNPPFWVSIKSLPLGTLYYTFVFLKTNIKSAVLNNFDLDISKINTFEQSIYVLKEIRNQCAHLELITRFKLKRTSKLNYFNDISIDANLSRTHSLNYMDVIKILNLYTRVTPIKLAILKFYIIMLLKGRIKIAKKILGKMGNQNILSWLKI